MIKLNQGSLSLFLDCPRCFWLQYRMGIYRPRVPSPTLLDGMDRELKYYFDRFRGKLPPELIGKVEGKLMEDSERLDGFRDIYQPTLFYYPALNFRFAGALDDCLVKEINGEKYYIPVDFKTRGTNIREPLPDYYWLQLSAYDLLLQKRGFKTLHKGYLVSYILDKVQKKLRVKLRVNVIQIKTNPDRLEEILQQAIAVLQKSVSPDAASNCYYCKYRSL